jgi:hypothetical protein
MGSDHQLSPIQLQEAFFRAGNAPVSRAWLPGATTKIGPEGRAGIRHHGSAWEILG